MGERLSIIEGGEYGLGAAVLWADGEISEEEVAGEGQ